MKDVWRDMEHMHCLRRSMTSLQEAQACLQHLSCASLKASPRHEDDKRQLGAMAKTLQELNNSTFVLESHPHVSNEVSGTEGFDFESIIGEL